MRGDGDQVGHEKADLLRFVAKHPAVRFGVSRECLWPALDGAPAARNAALAQDIPDGKVRRPPLEESIAPVIEPIAAVEQKTQDLDLAGELDVEEVLYRHLKIKKTTGQLPT
jgi:hypothetical protein